MAVENAPGNDGVTIPERIPPTKTCPACGGTFQPSGRRRHCSDACRQAAWRRRQAAWRRRQAPKTTEVPIPPRGQKRSMTVYECEHCASRELGVQRCEECNSWRRAVGVGATALRAAMPSRFKNSSRAANKTRPLAVRPT